MTRLSIGRRRLLKLLGLSSAAAAPVFRRGIARAADPSIVPKFVGLYHGCGHGREDWFLSDEVGERSVADANLPRLLAPFSSVKEKILQFRYLGTPFTESIGNHQLGINTLLTGLKWDGKGSRGVSRGPSIDQHIAQLGHYQQTALPSVQMGVRGRHLTLSHLKAGEPLPRIKDPHEAYRRLFAGVSLPESPGTPNPSQPFSRLRAQRKSALDYAAGEIVAMEKWLSASDRQRLDVHMQSIREIERRLDVTGGEMAQALGCGEGISALGQTVDGFTRSEWYESSAGGADDMLIPSGMKLQLDIMAAALLCGRTHIGTYAAGGGAYGWQYPWLGFKQVPKNAGDLSKGFTDAGHHALSHMNPKAPEYWEMWIKALEWQSGLFADFVGQLDQVQESDGQTVLDHSLVLWSSECGASNTHKTADIPFTMFGSAGGYFRTGRFINYGKEDKRCVTDLLTHIAKAFGREVDHFGDRRFSKGMLENLT